MSTMSERLVNVADSDIPELVLNHRARLSKQEVELPLTCSAVERDAT